MALMVNLAMGAGSLGLMAFGMAEWGQLLATLLIAYDVYLLADIVY